MQGYITLLSSENYLEAVLVLNLSLKKWGTRYPLICAVDKNIYSEKIKTKLEENDIIIELVNHLEYPEKVKQFYNSDRVNLTATKLQIFNLNQYDKLVYIDADVLVLKNIDDLFNYDDGSIVIMEHTPNIGFSGLFVFSPKNYNMDVIYNMLKNGAGLDGNIIATLFNKILINDNYKINENYLMPLWRFYSIPENKQAEVKVLHFCHDSYKPWMREFKENNKLLSTYSKLINKFK